MATILIVDDDPDALSILETFLRSRGHEAHGAAGGEQALARMDELHPEVVILDVMMPGLSGWDVARRIRRHPMHADTGIVMLTARDGEEARKEGTDAGADVYLVKPVGLEDLEDRIDGLLAEGEPYA